MKSPDVKSALRPHDRIDAYACPSLWKKNQKDPWQIHRSSKRTYLVLLPLFPPHVYHRLCGWQGDRWSDLDKRTSTLFMTVRAKQRTNLHGGSFSCAYTNQAGNRGGRKQTNDGVRSASRRHSTLGSCLRCRDPPMSGSDQARVLTRGVSVLVSLVCVLEIWCVCVGEIRIRSKNVARWALSHEEGVMMVRGG